MSCSASDSEIQYAAPCSNPRDLRFVPRQERSRPPQAQYLANCQRSYVFDSHRVAFRPVSWAKTVRPVTKSTSFPFWPCTIHRFHKYCIFKSLGSLLLYRPPFGGFNSKKCRKTRWEEGYSPPGVAMPSIRDRQKPGGQPAISAGAVTLYEIRR